MADKRLENAVLKMFTLINHFAKKVWGIKKATRCTGRLLYSVCGQYS